MIMGLENDLKKLEKLRDGYKNMIKSDSGSEDVEELQMLYGEVSDLILGITGTSKIEVPGHGNTVSVYPNYISAGLLSGRTHFRHQGYTEILSVVGKVRGLVNDPSVIEIPPTIPNLIQTLNKFRAACQYHQSLKSEKEVQDIIWIMLRPQYEMLEKEVVLPKFGVKNTKPDFGIPDLRTLIEVKYIGDSTKPGDIQEEIFADVPSYLSDQSKYDKIVVVVYDNAHKLKDNKKFIEAIRSVEGIIDVIVIEGF